MTSRPVIDIPGNEVKILLNNEDITELFTSNGTAELPLVSGENVLVIQEITATGIKPYTVYIGEKEVKEKIQSITALGDIYINAGDYPQLPSSVSVTMAGEARKISVLSGIW